MRQSNILILKKHNLGSGGHISHITRFNMVTTNPASSPNTKRKYFLEDEESFTSI